MYTTANRVWRLVEVRIVDALEAREFPRFKLAIANAMAGVLGRAVFCSDLRRMPLLPPDVFDAMLALFRTDNPKIERNALIVSTSSVVALQMQRLAQEAGSPGRRVFRAAADAERWLVEVLGPDELARARDFLAEGAAQQP